MRRLTAFEGEFDCLWIERAEVGFKGAGVLEMDGLSWAKKGEEGVEGDDADGDGHELR